MKKLQEKLEIINAAKNFSKLKNEPRLKYILEKVNKIIPDEEIMFEKHIIEEIQEKCPHDGGKKLDPLISVDTVRFDEICCDCGKTTRQNLTAQDL